MSSGYAIAAQTYLDNGWWPLPLPSGRKSPPPHGYTGRGGRALLDRINHWLKPKQWALGLLVCFATAIYLIVSGILAA
jgi:hypothetical protein